jgi:transposase
VPLAGYACRLWPLDDSLQSLPALVQQGNLAGDVGGFGQIRCRGLPGDRLDLRQSPPLRSGRKRGAERQAIGRSRGGRTTKIHAVTDALGRLLSFAVTPGQLGDVRAAISLLGPLPPPCLCAADTAYDSNGLRKFLADRGTVPVIPNNPTRKSKQPFDREPYKQRNVIERMFSRLKDWRRIATRYDKLAHIYASAVAIAAVVTWWT